jgi:hypothetical protein
VRFFTAEDIEGAERAEGIRLKNLVNVFLGSFSLFLLSSPLFLLPSSFFLLPSSSFYLV